MDLLGLDEMHEAQQAMRPFLRITAKGTSGTSGASASGGERSLSMPPPCAILQDKPVSPPLIEWWRSAPPPPCHWQLYFDGGSRGNPGPAGAGTVLLADGKERWSNALFVGHRTCNYAEYQGLLAGLQYCVQHASEIRQKVASLEIIGDSKLVIQQMKGVYAVRHPQLKLLHEEAMALVSQFKRICPACKLSFRHVYREDNGRADALANQAIDQRHKSSN